MAVDKRLSVRVADAAGAAECGEMPLLRAVCQTPAESYFVRAAGPRHNPGGLVGGSGGAEAVGAVPVAWNRGAIRSHSHPDKRMRNEYFKFVV